MTQSYHPTPATLLLVAGLSPLLALNHLLKPALSVDIEPNAFKLPPFPAEVVHVAPAAGGGMALTTLTPIAGRTPPVGEIPKPRGAVFPSNAAYLHTLTLGPDGQPLAI